MLNEKLYVSYMWSAATIMPITLAHGGVGPYDFDFFLFLFLSIFYSKVSNLMLTHKNEINMTPSLLCCEDFHFFLSVAIGES